MLTFKKLNEDIDKDLVKEVINYTHLFPHSQIDVENKKIVIPFSRGITEEGLMKDGMMGRWLIDNGFDIKFEVRDFEYETSPKTSYRHLYRPSGHTAYLRNRLVGTITWD